MILLGSTTTATDSSSPINSKTNPESRRSEKRASSRPHEYTSLDDLLKFPCTALGRSEKRASSRSHEYTSLNDLLKFPCTCQLCTLFRQQRESCRRLEPGPQVASSLATRVASASLLPLPDPPRRFRSKRLPLRRSPVDASLEFINRHVATAMSRAFKRLVGVVQVTEDDEEGSSPCCCLPFRTC